MLKTSIGVVVVRGHQAWQVVVGAAQDPASPIRLCMPGAGDESAEYVGPAGGVKDWARAKDLKYELHQLDLDVDSREVLAWKTVD